MRHIYQWPQGLAYSAVNGHIYATCSSVGLMEVNPVGDSLEAIARHSVGVGLSARMSARWYVWSLIFILYWQESTGGQVYESPEEKHIVSSVVVTVVTEWGREC